MSNKKPTYIFSQLAILIAILFYSCEPPQIPEDFMIEDSFDLSLVVQEPLIRDPVDLKFNELGDAMVLEMPGYPFEDSESRIVVLKDENGDGVFDRNIIFIKNLQLASAFIPYKKGVLVAAPPYLLHVRDDDQNYVPEGVDTLMSGFATGNLQHNFNGLTLGMDNWIYAANGGNDGNPYWWDDPSSRLPLRGQDFRFQVETKKLERLGESSGGFGLAMDEYGRVFETHNLNHLSHLVFPDRYIGQNQINTQHTLENISDHEENGLARIYPIGVQESRVNHPEQSGYFSGSCGITYYGGGAFGETYDNTIWVADVVLNLIHVDKLKPNGASFRGSRVLEKRDFLASSDRAFRPVNMSVGPNGALYVLDMHRKVIEHPEWIPDEIEKTLDINAGKDQGRIYRITRNGFEKKFDLSQFQNEKDLVKCLSHPNQWVRMTAHRLLLEELPSDAAIQELRVQTTSENDLAALHSLWILENTVGLDESELLSALDRPNPAIRENALVLSESRFDGNTVLAEAGIRALSDENTRVRMQAALSLSMMDQIDENAFLESIIQTAAMNNDQWTIEALVLAADQKSPQLLASLLTNPEPSVPSRFLESLALSAANKDGGLEKVLSSMAAYSINPLLKQKVVAQLTEGIGTVTNGALESYVEELEGENNVGVITELAKLRTKLKLPASNQYLTLSQEALVRVEDESLLDSIRLQQIALIELLPYAKKSEVLYACLDNTEPIKIQEAALRQLSNYREKEIGRKLIDKWSELSPHIRRYTSDMLLYFEVHHDALLTALENGKINIGEMNFDLERRRQLLWWTDNEDTKRRAEALFSDSGVTTRKEAVEKMRPALALDGFADNGAKVFENVCSSCHQYGAMGNNVGPKLTEIGRKSPETLLHDILDPNAAADPAYISHMLETKEGAVHLGIISSETGQSISMIKMGGESVDVNKNQIKSFRSLGTSLMMEGLENSMSHQEMADLLAYLRDGV